MPRRDVYRSALYLQEARHRGQDVGRDRILRALAIELQPSSGLCLRAVALTNPREHREVAFVLVPIGRLASRGGLRCDIQQDREVRLREVPLNLAQPRAVESLRFAV